MPDTARFIDALLRMLAFNECALARYRDHEEYRDGMRARDDSSQSFATSCFAAIMLRAALI